jgi:formylglycine-generating enzyme required for sulfatase activity
MRIFLSILLFSAVLAAQNRVALVVGNSKYIEYKELNNPVNDAKLIADTLKKVGFDVIYLENVTNRDFIKAIRDFEKKAYLSEVALFYFAGHGVHVENKNYLIGVDSNLIDSNEVKFNSLGLFEVVNVMKNAKSQTNIIILDACRNNPFHKHKKGGLVPFSDTQNFFVAYATQAGDVAYDGEVGGNSLFSKSLAKNIMIPNLDIEAVFKKTRADVYEKSDAKQLPATYSSIVENVYFTESTRSLQYKRANGKITKKIKKISRFHEPEMVYIPAGSYTMGSDDEIESSPPHQMKIKKSFYISIHEITFEAYDLFVKETRAFLPDDNGWGRINQPVINVSWRDAKKYCQWLSKKTSKIYKLPTEAQWEYVARSKGDKIYGMSDNDSLLGKYAWYEDTAKRHPYPIMQKSPNAYGVYDMLGNVREWVEDDYISYKKSEYRVQSDDANAINIKSSEKVVRGGSWYSEYFELSVYHRESLEEDTRDNATGFRIVLEDD